MTKNRNATTTPQIAILHANFGSGGGEVVAEELYRAIDQHTDADPDFYYCYSVDGGEPSDDIDSTQLFQQNRFADSVFYRDLNYLINLPQVDRLREYDVLIQSGNEFSWYVPEDDQTVIRYCHTPPRTPYDRFQELGSDSRIKQAYAFVARVLHEHTTDFTDAYIANSELIAKRMRKYWGRDADEVIYPPVDTDAFQPSKNGAQNGLYVTWSRLEPAKRIDEIVRAFHGLDDDLIVVGDGSQREEIEQLADGHENIHIHGYAELSELRALISKAEATVFNARNEDFGLVPIESMACGTPVLAINDGFQAHQIRDGVNGVRYDDPDPETIRSAVREFDGVAWSEDELREFAEQFSEDRFRREIAEIVEKTIEETRITETEIDFLDSREVIADA